MGGSGGGTSGGTSGGASSQRARRLLQILATDV